MSRPHGSDLVEQIIRAACPHGRASDPDHEVGDLQDAPRLAWALSTPRQQKEVHAAYFETHDDWSDRVRTDRA